MEAREMKVVYCKISSWKGRVPGADHYYVDLERRKAGGGYKRDQEKVWHTLTLSEAERVNRRGRDRHLDDKSWEAGEEVGYFFSRDRAVKGAVKAYKTIFPGAIILVEGTMGTYQPQPILDGPQEDMEAINDLVEMAEAIDWWEEDEEAMRAICDEWEAIWIPKFEKE
jgi:hypothetical protein